MNSNSTSHYTFGDSDLAAQRLEHLAEAYAESTTKFLHEFCPKCVSVAVDLGSGLGLTTKLLQSTTGSPTVIGYERSPRYLEAAQSRFPELIFRNIDVLAPEFPDQDIDLVYSRFLLTHLHEPEKAVTTSVAHLRRGGRLLLEETSDLRSSIRCLQTYYQLVGEMQTHYGQELYIGTRLHTMVERLAGCVVNAHQTSITLRAQTMARLHAMNIATWKADPFMRSTYGTSFLDAFETELETIATTPNVLPPVTCVMAQVVVEREV